MPQLCCASENAKHCLTQRPLSFIVPLSTFCRLSLLQNDRTEVIKTRFKAHQVRDVLFWQRRIDIDSEIVAQVEAPYTSCKLISYTTLYAIRLYTPYELIRSPTLAFSCRAVSNCVTGGYARCETNCKSQIGATFFSLKQSCRR